MERQEFGERKRGGEILINHEEYPKQKCYSGERMDMKNMKNSKEYETSQKQSSKFSILKIPQLTNNQ